MRPQALDGANVGRKQRDADQDSDGNRCEDDRGEDRGDEARHGRHRENVGKLLPWRFTFIGNADAELEESDAQSREDAVRPQKEVGRLARIDNRKTDKDEDDAGCEDRQQ